MEIHHPDGHVSADFIDFYRRGCFVCEAKQALAPESSGPGIKRDTAAWRGLMQQAFGQALKYASYLPEGKPPFLLTADIGHCFEVWSGFGGDYRGYGARRTIPLADLVDPTVRTWLRAVFTDPHSLDPSRRAARVTREVAKRLADLSVALESAGQPAERVARFLMRCLFTMFAEDTGLLPAGLFTRAIREDWIPEPRTFAPGIAGLWVTMDRGGPFGTKFLRRFNGGLFREVDAIDLTADQLRMLLVAAECDWSDVEPAIFGTLVERALDPVERHSLGAHFTPREYIERLVRPTVLDPLRAEWVVVQAEVRQLLDAAEGEPSPADRKKAVAAMKAFHQRLCDVRVLDPACGTGNFLYVTLDLMQELEDEVLRDIADAGDRQALLDIAGVAVHPSQFLGIEVNPRAREIAELVLWLGWLQGFRRRHPDDQPPEPILGTAHSIECRDAVLAFDEARPRLDSDGKPVSVWDMKTLKVHPVTGREVPDEAARVAVMDYANPRPAEWPAADFIVSNPPFLGNKRMREALGDGYTEALRKAWPQVDGSVDLVMYWWDRAAQLVRAGAVRRFGMITTNSLTQSFNRTVVERYLKADGEPLAIAWAIADHPWVIDGAAVRIAMTTACRASELRERPVLGRVDSEGTSTVPRDCGEESDTVAVTSRAVPTIHADLSGGADVAGAVALKSNLGMSFMGMTLIGHGFRVSRDEIRALGFDPECPPAVIRPHMNARELTRTSEDRFVIDLHGLDAVAARECYPTLYQRLLERVKPEREQNKDQGPKERWWLFGRSRPDLREALTGLSRYIITPETSKHRFFVFASMTLIPDHSVYAVCADDAYVLAVLSSHPQCLWATSTGAHLGYGNDLRWRNTRCFDPFPFPDANEAQKARIRSLGEQLDAHRKSVQAAHPDVTLTGMYNGLERLREAEAKGPPLNPKERAFHDTALIGLLKTIHDDLDAAVADAYGWPVDLPDADILTRLVALNRLRADQEANGVVRWLRPDFQRARAGLAPVQQSLDGMDETATATAKSRKPAATTTATVAPPRPWPAARAAQIQSVRDAAAARTDTFDSRELAAVFTGAPTASLRRHLDTLEALGLLTGFDAPRGRRWSAR